ncbi:GNAT family N-acetyltransferase [Gracilimonas tropica]|uniref:GNAT family N-acetyltransferase n=1 Tax=Gracilimonas tropica TaxID=454600 RepID=UPI00039DCCBB|nr:GNAT family N-acetyltransferase [Gracilimonas tropica]
MMEFSKHKLEKWESYGLSNDLITVYKSFLNQESNKRYYTEYFKSLESLVKYQNQWDELAESVGNPLLLSSWFTAGAKAFEMNSQLMFLTIMGNNLSAVAPMALKGKVIPHLEILGSSILREPTGFLYDSKSALDLLIKALLDTKMPVYIRGLYNKAPEAILLEEKLKVQLSVEYSKEYAQIPYVAIQENWDSFEQRLSPRRRSSFRRLQKKVEKTGEVQFDFVKPTEKNFARYLDEVLKVESANWKGRIGTAIATHPTLKIFFSEYGRKMAKKGLLRLNFMRIDGKAIAVHFGVEYDNRLWLLKIGYDEEWSSYSPGILLMHHVVRHCFECGLEGVEFLGNDDDWLHIWATGVHELVSYSIYPKSIEGKLVKLQDKLAVYYHDTLNHGMYKWKGVKKHHVRKVET